MPRKTGRDPAQYGLFATPLEAMIAPDAEVRVIAAFVDQLNLLELDFQPINTMGASAYGPEVLLKIYLYGYLNRVRSSRRLAVSVRPSTSCQPQPCARALPRTKAKAMRHTPEAIRQFLIEQPLSGQTVATFCEDHDLKVPTFYSWKKKYGESEVSIPTGFCKITPKREYAERSLRLPSGLRLELIGLTTTEIAELILEIDRAHA